MSRTIDETLVSRKKAEEAARQHPEVLEQLLAEIPALRMP